MILQPLVENSVKYGVAVSSRPVTIEVIAAADADMLVLTVRDDGPNTDPEQSVGCGIGLANIRDRLMARFGLAASVVPEVPPEGGFRTVIRFPLRRRHG
jgi:sensor histidine kinase YesM